MEGFCQHGTEFLEMNFLASWATVRFSGTAVLGRFIYIVSRISTERHELIQSPKFHPLP